MIRFTYSTSDWVLSNPIRQNMYNFEKPITFGRSASGQLYRYLKGFEIKRVVLEFEYLTDAEKSAAQTAFSTIGTNDFTYTDHLGVTMNARFVVPRIEFKEMWDEKSHQQNFTIDLDTIVSTTRKNPRWAFQVELEVWAS